MARPRGRGDVSEPVSVEQWYAEFRERFRPNVAKMLAVFDQLPRRPDEERCRTALEDELLEMLETACRAIGFGDNADAASVESGLFAAMLKVQARVMQALAERQGEVTKA
jgi:hypothetical protein